MQIPVKKRVHSIARNHDPFYCTLDININLAGLHAGFSHDGILPRRVAGIPANVENPPGPLYSINEQWIES